PRKCRAVRRLAAHARLSRAHRSKCLDRPHELARGPVTTHAATSRNVGDAILYRHHVVPGFVVEIALADFWRTRRLDAAARRVRRVRGSSVDSDQHLHPWSGDY